MYIQRVWGGMTIFSYRKDITRDHVDVSRQIARRERLLGWSFPGDCLPFFFLLSSFLLVNDLWPNIEGYSIIIIITATLCSLFFFSFCLRWRSVKFFIFVVQIECDDTLEIIVSIYFFFNLSKRIVFVQWYVNHQFWNN